MKRWIVAAAMLLGMGASASYADYVIIVAKVGAIASILFAFPDSVTGVLLVAVRIYVVLAIGLIVIRSPRSSWRRSMASVTSTPSGGNGSGTPRTSLIGEH